MAARIFPDSNWEAVEIGIHPGKFDESRSLPEGLEVHPLHS